MPTITSGSEVLPVTASGWTVPSARTRTLSSLLIDVSLRTSDGEMVVLVEVVLVDVLLVELDVEDGTEVAPATVVVGAAVAEVQTHDIHARLNHGGQDFYTRRGWA